MKKYMYISIELLNKYKLNIKNIFNCMIELIKIIDIEYSKLEIYISNNYWKKGWLKIDTINKIKFKNVEMINLNDLDLSGCNDLLFEMKIKKDIVLDIGFSPTYNSDLIVTGYHLDLFRKGVLFDNDIIMNICECVKKYTNANDKIIIRKDEKLTIIDSDTIIVLFSDFK